MAQDDRRARRFSLLAQVQKKRVDDAARSHQSALQASQLAREKLAGLKEYFEQGPAITEGHHYSMLLNETSVFGSRLNKAIAAQEAVCQQLDAQVEHARQFLLSAEKRRVGLNTAAEAAVRMQNLRRQQLEQRRTDDSVMSQYCRRG